MNHGRNALYAVLGSLAAAGTTAALAWAAVKTPRGQRLDELAMLGARADRGPLHELVYPVLNVIGIPFIVGALAVAVLWALLRGRVPLALSMLALVAGANISTQVVKRFVLSRETLAAGLEATPNSFPSGHTTIAASIATVFVLVSPPKLRPWVSLLGAAWLTLTGTATMIDGWHRPSDVLGAIGVTACWSLLFLASASWIRRREAAISASSVTTASDVALTAQIAFAALAILAGILAPVIFVPSPLLLTDPAQRATAYLATLLLLAGTSVLYLSGVSLFRAAADGVPTGTPTVPPQTVYGESIE